MAESTEQGKTAGAVVYLMEELGDARMRCDQLLRYVEKASQLIEKSSHKDHFFEVAGDVIRGIPETTFKLHKALEAVALAANRIDYEEIKQDLRPEKVEELERVLKDVRVRQVQRRSQPMVNPANVVQQLKSLAKQAREKGSVDTAALSTLIASLEVEGKQKVADNGGATVASQLEAMVHALENPPKGELPSRTRLAQALRRTLGENLKLAIDPRYEDGDDGITRPPGEPVIDERAPVWQPQTAAGILNDLGQHTKALARKLESGRTQGAGRDLFSIISAIAGAAHLLSMPRLYDALMRTKPMSVVPSHHNAAENGNSRSAAGVDVEIRKLNVLSQEVAKALDTAIHNAEIVEKGMQGLPDFVHHSMENLPGAIASLKKIRLDTFGWGGLSFDIKTAADDEKRSRYEEGKPADPTENMSKEDAADWKENTEKHKDKFKAAADDVVVYEKGGVKLTATVADAAKLRNGKPVNFVFAGDDEKRSRYEEGKSADPTENMSEEDAKDWKENTEKHKDKFKAASGVKVAKKEVKTPDLDTVEAVGKRKGEFGEEYYVIPSHGMETSWNPRSHGKDLKTVVRYKLRNEYNVPTKRIDEILKELDGAAKAASDDARAWKA